MSAYARPATVIDAAWRIAFRLDFPLARIWWHLRRPHHEGALVAIYVGKALLLVGSLSLEWNFPCGIVWSGETPEAAAKRELVEEIGLTASPLLPAGEASGIWDGRRDRMHFFELRLDRPPELRLDNREIITVRLLSPSELRGMALTEPVASHLGRTSMTYCPSG